MGRAAPAAMACTALLLALAINAAWLWSVAARPPSPEAGQRPALLDTAALQADPAVRSYTLHRASGERVDSFSREETESGLAVRVAALMAPPEITCNPAPLGDGSSGTLCVESSPAPLVPLVRRALTIAAVSSLLALLLGWLAGRAIVRSLNRPLFAMAETLARASRESAYSLRVEPASGDLGRLATAVNELLAQMQERELTLRRRSVELEAANKDLEGFAFTVSHDLRAPLGSIDGFTQAIVADYGDMFDANGHEYVSWIREGCRQMRDLIDGLLQMSRLTRQELQREHVDLSAIARSIADSLKQSDPERAVTFRVREGVTTVGDERLLRAVLENLMQNAFKFTRKREQATIEFGADDGTYWVRDNGAGFDPAHAAKMFRPFQRLHSSREFEGTGIGLATVQKIVERHGGRAWAEGEIERGATIYFTVHA